ncbi:MAG: hypothetical protein A2Z34_03035 [Planctomycetes bacterium RBG_16_59_8]|nr:MAG: hypothetical protein A2Z34_03035 [Planctomycetes bacterium RBG_16_59_8]
MPVVMLFAGLRDVAGIVETRIEGDELRKVIVVLTDRFPALRQHLFDGESPRPHVIVTVNGQNVRPEQWDSAPLVPDDRVALFPPIAGG